MIVTIGTRKGGSGKSTLSTNLAALRKSKGHDVSLVDTDDQKSAAMWGAVRGDNEKLKYIPIMRATGNGVLQAIAAHAEKYEDLIIDSPGKQAIELRAAVMASDVLVIPLRASQFDLWATEQDLDMAIEVASMKKQMQMPFRVIICFNGINPKNTVRNKQIAGIHSFLEGLQEKVEQAGAEIFDGFISHREVFNLATLSGEAVIEAATSTNSDQHAVHEITKLYDFIYNKQ